MAFLSSFYPQPVVAGTTAGTYAEGNDSRIVGAAQKASNLSDLASVSTARTNLQLGNSATRNVGTGSTQVAAGNHNHSNATESAAGFLSASDKIKINGIAAGAEVNVNADWNATTGDAAILNKPSTFTPSSHTHVASDITDFASAVGAISPAADWNTLSNKPSTFPPSSHTHQASDINSGTFNIARIPTGSTSSTVSLGNHGHELNSLAATGIVFGKVLTSTGSNSASWENPSGSGDVEEAPEDGVIYGRKDADWVNITEPANLQIRRGTAEEAEAITPLEGEPIWETDTKVLRVGDGSTLGGIAVGNFPLKGSVSTVDETGIIDDVEYFLGGELGKIQINDELELRGYDGDLDFTHVAGGARGEGSLDFQMVRSQESQIASGVSSTIIGGRENTASGNQSAIISGQNVTCSGFRSLAIGGSNISITASGGICIAGTGSGTVAGENSIVIGSGGETTSNAFNSVCFSEAISDRPYMTAKRLGSGQFTGRSQSIEFGLRAKTTSATPKEMEATTTVNNKFSIPNNVAVFGTIEICAIEEANATEAAHYIRKFAIQNLGGTTQLIGTVTSIGTDYESDSGYDVSITADNTNDLLKVEVTGDSSKTLRWLAVIKAIEIAI